LADRKLSLEVNTISGFATVLERNGNGNGNGSGNGNGNPNRETGMGY
jgi:hypothetical protein